SVYIINHLVYVEYSIREVGALGQRQRGSGETTNSLRPLAFRCFVIPVGACCAPSSTMNAAAGALRRDGGGLRLVDCDCAGQAIVSIRPTTRVAGLRAWTRR